MDAKQKPWERQTPTAATLGTGPGKPHSVSVILHQNPDLVKHKYDRYLTYSPRSTWCILGPMLTVAGRLGLGDLVDDLLELGRSWQARGVAL